MVTKEKAFKTSLMSGAIIAAIVYYINVAEPWIVAGIATMIVGYLGMTQE